MPVDFDDIEDEDYSAEWMSRSRATGLAKWLASLAPGKGAALPYGEFSIPSARSTCSSVGKELNRVFKLKADIKKKTVHIMRIS